MWDPIKSPGHAPMRVFLTSKVLMKEKAQAGWGAGWGYDPTVDKAAPFQWPLNQSKSLGKKRQDRAGSALRARGVVGRWAAGLAAAGAGSVKCFMCAGSGASLSGPALAVCCGTELTGTQRDTQLTARVRQEKPSGFHFVSSPAHCAGGKELRPPVSRPRSGQSWDLD